MRRMPRRLAWMGLSAIVAIALVASNGARAEYDLCNGKPVRPKSIPMGFVVNGCSIHDNSTPRGRSAVIALSELGEYAPLGKLASWAFGSCSITHGDGQSDMAVVDRAAIDGLGGLTLSPTDGCTFSWETEHITESDVMVAADHNFDEPDHSLVATQTTDIGLGRAVMLHESGHAVGLNHTGGFAIMRDGLGARMPYIGGSYGGFGAGNSGHVKFTANDVHNLRGLHGIPQDYPDLYVSAQWLRRSGKTNMVLNNNSDENGVPMSTPKVLCPGDALNMMTTVGNLSQFSRSSDLRIYADSAGNCTPLDGVGTELSRWSVSVGGYGNTPFIIHQSVPASIPRGVLLRVYAAINVSDKAPGEKKAFNDCARSAALIMVKQAASCGM